MTEIRPQSIRWFEGLSIGSLLLALINVVFDPNINWIFAVVLDGIVITLILLVSRGRKNWARWLLAVLFALGLLSMILTLRATLAEENPAITLAFSLLLAAGLLLLFTPQSSAWFRKSTSLAETCS